MAALAFVGLMAAAMVVPAPAWSAAPVSAAPRIAPASVDLGDLGPLDLRDLDAVFAAVFAALPDQLTVHPSENYQYVRFQSGGVELRGNLRLGVLERDAGGLHFAYYEHRAEGVGVPGALGPLHRLLGAADGLSLVRAGEGSYDASFGGRTVRFDLHLLDQSPPRLWSPAPGEVVLFRTLDESMFGFFLVFDEGRRAFSWVLDEERALPDTLLPVGGAPHLLLGQHSGFVFRVEPEHGERKVLLAVHAPLVRENSYYDGPFDQLADNHVGPDSRLQASIEQAYPETAGRIDAFGHFVDRPGSRVAIAPYASWEDWHDLAVLAGCADAPDEAAACIAPPSLSFAAHDGRTTLHTCDPDGTYVRPVHIYLVTYSGSIPAPPSPTGNVCERVPQECAGPVGEHDGVLSVQHTMQVSMAPSAALRPVTTVDQSLQALGTHKGLISTLTWDHADDAAAFVKHDESTSRTCTDPVHVIGPSIFGHATCAAVHVLELSFLPDHAMEVSIVASSGRRAQDVVHETETTRGCTDRDFPPRLTSSAIFGSECPNRIHIDHTSECVDPLVASGCPMGHAHDGDTSACIDVLSDPVRFSRAILCGGLTMHDGATSRCIDSRDFTPSVTSVAVGNGAARVAPLEPNTPSDTSEVMWQGPPPADGSDRVYFDVRLRAVDVGRGLVHFEAYLGYWRDCNGDGAIGDARSGATTYPALVDTSRACPPGSRYHDGRSVRELLLVGPGSPHVDADARVWTRLGGLDSPLRSVEFTFDPYAVGSNWRASVPLEAGLDPLLQGRGMPWSSYAFIPSTVLLADGAQLPGGDAVWTDWGGTSDERGRPYQLRDVDCHERTATGEDKGLGLPLLGGCAWRAGTW